MFGQVGGFILFNFLYLLIFTAIIILITLIIILKVAPAFEYEKIIKKL